jgi:ubiquinone/menaquinone biosynthesis C-methylase UbiE
VGGGTATLKPMNAALDSVKSGISNLLSQFSVRTGVGEKLEQVGEQFSFHPVLAVNRARALTFLVEGFAMNLTSRFLPFAGAAIPEPPAELKPLIRDAALELLERDALNIQKGIYPASVLVPEPPLKHALRFPRLVVDGVRIAMKRSKGRTTVFDEESRKRMEGLPRYYQRNFHFQTNGYLSDESAELYEHQVEVLFGGTADAMRRMLISPLRERFGDGAGMRILEVAAGTGRMSRFLALAFPKAEIVVTEISRAYLNAARSRLFKFKNVDFLQADVTALPFESERFDAVVSVFLFHELPMEERRKALQESMRVLKSGGFLGLIDSLQLGDEPRFDPMLELFPIAFHEPFYRNYSENSMERLLEEAGVRHWERTHGFLSKALWGGKAPA